MDLSKLRIGIIHSLIGKNDGVSIIIDESIQAMIENMKIPLGNLFFLAGHSAARFHTMLDDVFWHKNDSNKYICNNFTQTSNPAELEKIIIENSDYAEKIIDKWVNENDLDIVIAHNSCHPSNFIYSVALGRFFEKLRSHDRIRPRYLLWWHDSHFERPRFSKPNAIIKKYLQYTPSPHVDGIIFINSQQIEFGKQYFTENKDKNQLETFFEKKTTVIPNIAVIPGDWDLNQDDENFYPPLDQFNKTFFRDTGIERLLKQCNKSYEDTIFFLQHTRIVQRKRIDKAIDYVFEMAKKYEEENQDKILLLVVSGHGGDEHDKYRKYLEHYFAVKKANFKGNINVFLKFIEHLVLHEREVVVEKKFYRFKDIPGIIAHVGGIGTYFSEVEGYGNNLLEMMACGLPVVINEYPVYKTDIKPLEFFLPSIENGDITKKIIEESYELLNDKLKRLFVVKHNLKVLRQKLNPDIMSETLTHIIENILTYN